MILLFFVIKCIFHKNNGENVQIFAFYFSSDMDFFFDSINVLSIVLFSFR